MIIQSEKERVLTSLKNKEQQFTITSSPKAFAVLMDGLYSNKALAIIRELTSNAYDAHIQAGQERPFEITAPTPLVPTFTVRDYGESMDHEFVMKMYSSVFYSSKEDTNDQVGTFGLGSKSPFAYADTFNLTTYRSGMERMYSCFLNPDRIPCIVLLGEVETEEPDGTLVSFDVSAKDISDFGKCIQQIARAYWRLPPVVKNIAINTKPPRGLNHIDIDEVYVFDGVTATNTYTKFYFSQGNVWYPVPNEFTSGVSKTYAKLDIFEIPYNTSMAIVMDVPIGTFNVGAARESISLDKFSIEKINEYINGLQDKIKKAIETVYEPCKTRLDYSLTYRKLRGCGIASRLVDYKYTASYKKESTVKPTTLSSSIMRVLDDTYYGPGKHPGIPSGDLKVAELKPGFLYMPGYKANTWNAVVSLGGSVYFDWDKLQIWSGVEKKLVRKATRLKSAVNRNYATRENNLLCFTQDLPRFVRILGLTPDQVQSIEAIPDPGAPDSSSKKKATSAAASVAAPAKVWKADESFIVVVAHHYVSAKDPYCMPKYGYTGYNEKVNLGDIGAFWSNLFRNMTEAEKTKVGTLKILPVYHDQYDGDDSRHFYKVIMNLFGEDKIIEIMLRTFNIYSAAFDLDYEGSSWTHPFKGVVNEALEAAGYTDISTASMMSAVAWQKCPFQSMKEKADKLAEEYRVELKAKKRAILNQYPVFKIRDRKQLIKFLEESKCITSSTSSDLNPSPTTTATEEPSKSDQTAQTSST